jgi:transcriptional accessory protein Tex/SPT6
MAKNKKYMVAGIYQKAEKDGGTHFNHIMQTFEASSEHEAIGKAVETWAEAFPDHSLFLKPLVEELQDNSVDSSLTDREKEAHKLANNALYFDDNSDFESALWNILDLFRDTDSQEDLEYMD